MNLQEQMKKLAQENDQLRADKSLLDRKYEAQLDEIKKLKMSCNCEGVNPELEGHSERLKMAELEICKLKKLAKDLESENSLLKIQLTTYKEDFAMERKDREVAQERVIKLEQELSDLCSGKCSDTCPPHSRRHQSDREVRSNYFNDAKPTKSPDIFDKYDVVPSFIDYEHLNKFAPSLKDTFSSRHEAKKSSGSSPELQSRGCSNVARSSGSKNIRDLLKKKTNQQNNYLKASRSPERIAHYESDCPNNNKVELRSRFCEPNRYQQVTDNLEVDSFTFINKDTDNSFPPILYHDEELHMSSDFVAPSYFYADAGHYKPSSIIKVIPQTTCASTIGTSKLKNSSISACQADITPRPSQDVDDAGRLSLFTDPNNILKCPGCSKMFRADTEHFQLLQHMDCCGQ